MLEKIITFHEDFYINFRTVSLPQVSESIQVGFFFCLSFPLFKKMLMRFIKVLMILQMLLLLQLSLSFILFPEAFIIVT